MTTEADTVLDLIDSMMQEEDDKPPRFVSFFSLAHSDDSEE